MSISEIRVAAMCLSPEEKVQLAEDLLASLDPQSQAATDADWAVEAERRIDEIDAGRSQLAPFEDVMRELDSRQR